MWPSPLFRRIAASLIGLGWIALGLGMWVIARDQREFAVMAQQRHLAAAAARLGDRLPEDLAASMPEALTAQAAQLAAEIDVAFAIVGADGRVLAGAGDPAVEREARAATSVSHRPALVKAARYGQGFARARTTGGGYVPAQCAVRVERSGRTAGFVCALDVRPAPMPGADSWRRAGAWSAALIAALATPLAWRLSRRVTGPLVTLTRAVKQLGDGHYDWRTTVPRQPELRDLASAIDRMSRAVRRRETLLRENLERRETVLSGMLEGVIAVDQEERVLFANAAAGKLLDFAPREVEQRTLLEAVRCHPLRTLVRDALGSGEPRRREVKFLGPPSRELEVHAMPLRGQPCPGIILVIDDLTQMRRLESARQQFISNVSHELKTPLSSIKAYTETLLGGARHDPEHCERFLGRIAEQAERLHQLILDMLSLARIESGQAALELSDVDVAEVAARSIAAHEALAAAKGVALVDETAASLAAVRADDEGLREILDNLIDNAVKYTPPGGRVVVRARPIDRFVAVEVEDTGVGIPPEHLDRVFERFYRVDKARSRELGGTGLGLSIVKHLAQAMGGQVGVESEPGRGSVFAVRLPLASVAPPIGANS